jgi:solute carrier family 25 phosphate transporter 3
MLLVGARIASASVGDDNYDDALEQLALGDGRWTPLKGHRLETRTHIYPTFITYATRFLINYDPGVRQWWSHLQQTYSLLPESKRNEKLLTTFGAFARSLELSVIELVQQHPSHKQAYEELWDQFTQQYNHDEESKRQITLLFAMLPGEDQPVTRLRANNVATRQRKTVSPPSSDTAQINGLTDLLSSVYMCVGDQASPYFAVAPTITTAATSSTTPFGPLGELPLIREQPLYNAVTYALLGLSGSAGCAVTHSLVIPLDVVKTRNQIDSAQYKSVIGSGLKIFKEEGMQGLFLGSQATLAGYLWYGVSVYPCYTLFKRFASFHLANEVVAVSTDSIALFAGAVASIVASVGLTPLEAARIRVVAEPDKYREIGLVGTLQTISNENGWTGLYTGFPSLVTRQVIFGSIKFLAFERACSFAFSIWPALHDETWTSLVVSLFAGAFSGALSSIISQPADAVLTHVAQDTATQNRNLLKAGFAMVATDGVGSLFRGVGSRCIWATCIIAGQFFLYDIFRTYSGVSIDDLSQIYQVVLPSVT